MKALIVGSSGMLGRVLCEKFLEIDVEVISIARHNSTYEFDLLYDLEELVKVIQFEKPDIVINSAAMINLIECEKNIENAYFINSKVPSVLNNVCEENKIHFIQISTDHYFVNDKDIKHTETSGITLLNEYARTKYAGECFTLTSNYSLVVRTNIIGFKYDIKKPTFVEWVLNSLEINQQINGFSDYYTSSIDVYHFTDLLIELIQKRVHGLINIGSTDVLSKLEFIRKIGRRLGKEDYIVPAIIKNNGEILRATTLGLDTQKLRSIISHSTIPNSDQVIERILNEYYKGGKYETY